MILGYINPYNAGIAFLIVLVVLGTLICVWFFIKCLLQEREDDL